MITINTINSPRYLIKIIQDKIDNDVNIKNKWINNRNHYLSNVNVNCIIYIDDETINNKGAFIFKDNEKKGQLTFEFHFIVPHSKDEIEAAEISAIYHSKLLELLLLHFRYEIKGTNIMVKKTKEFY